MFAPRLGDARWLARRHGPSLRTDPDRYLWIGTDGGGVVLYKDGKFQSYSAADGLTNGFVRTIYQDSKGVVWVGTDDGLFSVRGWRLTSA